MAVATADDRKQRFIDLLHELFQLDKPELDFGLYRIMHAKSDQLSRFIREDLAESIEEAFSEQGELQLTAMRQEIEEKRRQAEELGAPDPDSAPAVKQAKAAYDVAKREQNASADIYDHLYRFFSRYYDKGDFMSRRHHVAENDSRAAPYAVPYDGREVYLHWANKDQYYVKSSETLANYTFNLNEALKKLHGSAAQGGLGFDSVDAVLKVHCRVVEATEGEHNNVKESAERFFIIHQNEAVRLEGADLVLQFEYRPDSNKTGQSGTWQKKRLEEAEEIIMAALRTTNGVAVYRDRLATPAPTEKQKSRTILGKYLQQYTARNAMDYFIHKDLGGFLSRELDFYIKNEILRLDDIDNAGVLVVEQQLKRVQVLRKIAKQVITFLAQLENFQKKLWLKKKFVTEKRYCVTIDRLKDEDVLREVLSDAKQQEQWVDLYSLDLNELKKDLVELSLREFVGMEKYRCLMVDTSVLPGSLANEIVSCCSAELDGVLIEGDSFHGCRAIENSYKSSISKVYIDPPYNTGSDGFAYKDGYKHSSWMSMINDRVRSHASLMKKSSLFAISIDKDENRNLLPLLFDVFGEDGFVEECVWQKAYGGGAKTKHINNLHEYVHVFSKSKEGLPYLELPPSDEVAKYYKYKDEKFAVRGAYRLQPLNTNSNDFRSNLTFPIPVYDCLSEADLRKISKNEIVLDRSISGDWGFFYKDGSKFMITCACPKSQWQWSWEKAKEALCNNELQFDERDGAWVVSYKQYLCDNDGEQRGSKPSSIYIGPYTQTGTAEVRSIFGEDVTKFPKPTGMLEKFLGINYKDNDGIVLDGFAGSGSTAHAVINLNRADEGSRKYILCDIGSHIKSVAANRIKKLVYSKVWRDGKPLPDDSESFNGISHCFAVYRLESYDETINNLELDDAPQRDALMEENPELRRDYTLKYLLDVETRGSASLLNTEWFRDPEGYTLKVKQPGSDETRETAVDLVETFNWLIGLHVTHLDKPRTYVARFEREEDPELPGDQNTRLKAASLRENEDGAYWIRQVEGYVRRIPGSDEDLAKVLVVWRKLTSDPEKDAAVLEALLAKYKIGTNDSEFDAIYINGPHGLNLTGSARNRVHSLEETFHARMWEGCDDEL